MKSIAILEFVCGGGFQDHCVQDIPLGLLQEGQAMLEAIATDWSRLPEWKVHVAWDPRLGRWQVPTIQVHNVEADQNYGELWSSIATKADYVLLIAPELDGQLLNLVRALQSVKSPLSQRPPVSLNADAAFLEATCDKWLTAQFLQQSHFVHPETKLLSDILAGDEPPFSAGCLWVVKPRDGAGCEAILRVQSRDQLRLVLDRFTNDLKRAEQFIIQPWLDGQAGSVAVLCGSTRCVLPAMTQDFAFPREDNIETLVYQGGAGPWLPLDAVDLERWARSVIEAMPGKACGWIGIDFVVARDELGKKTLIPIEINPRLTTSYLGVRSIVDGNLADMLYLAATSGSVSYSIGHQPVRFSTFGVS